MFACSEKEENADRAKATHDFFLAVVEHVVAWRGAPPFGLKKMKKKKNTSPVTRWAKQKSYGSERKRKKSYDIPLEAIREQKKVYYCYYFFEKIKKKGTAWTIFFSLVLKEKKQKKQPLYYHVRLLCCNSALLYDRGGGGGGGIQLNGFTEKLRAVWSVSLSLSLL